MITISNPQARPQSSVERPSATTRRAQKHGQHLGQRNRRLALQQWLVRMRRLFDAQKLGLSFIAVLIVLGIDDGTGAKAKATVAEALLKRAWERSGKSDKSSNPNAFSINPSEGIVVVVRHQANQSQPIVIS